MWMLIAAGFISAVSLFTETCEVIDYSVQGEGGRALLCLPQGKGPFPVVMYNHGAVVDFLGYDGARQKGYDMQGIARALAREGFLVFAPIRQSGRGHPAAHLKEIHRAVTYLKTLPQADTSRMALMGFSRGGALTLRASLQHQEFGAVILQAPALRPDRLDTIISAADSLSSRYLLLIEKSDRPEFIRSLAALNSRLRQKGSRTVFIQYDQGGGHRLFWKVDYYWKDVLEFLHKTIGP